MKGFLYGKTEYNILASATKLDDYISYAKKKNALELSYMTEKERNVLYRK